MAVETIGVIGFGHFGQFIVDVMRTLTPDITVRVHSRRHAPDGQQFFTLDDACATDAVILCGAISEFEEQLQAVVAAARPDTIIIDVATVKEHTSALLKKYASDRHFIATHPMFGPESYKKTGGNISGFRIVVTDYALTNDQYVRFKSFIQLLGFTLIEMSAEEHDRKIAETLFVTHLIGQTVTAGSFGRTDLDTVSFGFLMDAVESVRHDTKLFQDVFRYNPHCRAVLQRYDAAETKVIRDILGVEES